MQFVSVYTVPAFNNSKILFQKDNMYFFSNDGTGKYNLNEIKKSVYLGVGESYLCNNEENNIDSGYIKIKYIGKIINILNFDIEINDNKVHFIEGNGLSDNEKKAFNKQVDEFHRFGDGKIDSTIPLNMNLVKVEEIIEINEKFLYPKREIIALPLNLDNNGDYLKLENFLDTIKLTDSISLNIKNKYLIKDGKKIEISGDNAGIYVLILKNIFLSNDKAFSISLFENECKNINVNFKMNYEYLNSSILRGFNKYFKDKVPFEIGFSQNKKLNFNDIKDENNVFYLKEN